MALHFNKTFINLLSKFVQTNGRSLRQQCQVLKKIGYYSHRNISTSNINYKIYKSLLPEITLPNKTFPDFLESYLEKHSNKVAIECFDSGRQYTYDEIILKYKIFATNLKNKLGLSNTDAITVVLPNVAEFPIISLGIIEANYVCSTCNPNYTSDEIKNQLINSTSKCVITIDTHFETVKKAVEQLKQPLPIIVLRTKSDRLPKGAHDFNDFINPNTDISILKTLTEPPLNNTIFRPYSSGTTGLPKGVDLTHINIISNLLQQQNLGSNARRVSYISPNDQMIMPAVLPFFHIFGLSVLMFGELMDGNKLIAMPTFNTDNFVKVFKRYQPHKLFCVPPLVLLMISNDDITKTDLSQLGIILNGAAPLSTTDIDRLRVKTRPDLQFVQGYGLTETAPVVICYSEANKDFYNTDSIGTLPSSTEGRIVDPSTGKDSETGEFWVRGPQVMKGYYNNIEATKEVITEDGWFKTGDIMRIDEKGLFYITDRIKELIKVKGFQVAPAELEAIIRTHPDIIDAAVIGVKHQFLGEAPKAFVVTRKGKKVTEKEIQDFVSKKVTEYKQLVGGVVFIDSIPKSAAGKILRRQLK